MCFCLGRSIVPMGRWQSTWYCAGVGGIGKPWYLATSLPDAKVAVQHYRRRMQPEQYFRDGKQYFALDRGTATTTARLSRLLVGLLLACCLLLLAGRRASWRFRRRLCLWGQLAGTAAVGHGCAIWLRRSHRPDGSACLHMKVGTPEIRGSISFQVV